MNRSIVSVYFLNLLSLLAREQITEIEQIINRKKSSRVELRRAGCEGLSDSTRGRAFCNVSGVENSSEASPEGSRLSICGDSSDELRRGLLEVTEEAESGAPGFPSTPRDDESELSFYRRLLISSAGDRGCGGDEYNDRLRRTFRRLRLGDRSEALRLYTVQDYQNMKHGGGKLDRSLGPDAELINPKVCNFILDTFFFFSLGQ